MKKEQRLLLGAHMSIAGGLDRSLLSGSSIGCTAIQIFTHNNRQWGFKPLAQEQIDVFKMTQRQTDIKSVVCHASYLINLGSSTKEVVKKSRETLAEELRRCNKLGIKYLVLHPGTGSPADTCIDAIASGINDIFAKDNGTTILCLETMAGQGASVGKTFEELAKIRSLVTQKKRIGFCLDTCHIWAAGYNIAIESGYKEMMHKFDASLGLSHLHVLHLNDSKKERGSRVDRHETIGKGTMGLNPFVFIMNDQKLFGIPKLLETPKATIQDDRKNIETLLNLLNKDTLSKLDVTAIIEKQ